MCALEWPERLKNCYIIAIHLSGRYGKCTESIKNTYWNYRKYEWVTAEKYFECLIRLENTPYKYNAFTMYNRENVFKVTYYS